MTKEYSKSWLSLTLELDESGLIPSSRNSAELTSTVLDFTKNNEQLREEGNEMFTGHFIKKRIEDIQFDPKDANLLESMGIGNLRQWQIVRNRPEFLKKFDTILFPEKPPEAFDNGVRLVKSPESEDVDCPEGSYWYVSDSDVDDEGEFRIIHFKDIRKEADVSSTEPLKVWLEEFLRSQKGLVSLGSIGSLWREKNPESPRVKELTQESGFKNLKDFIEVEIEPLFSGDLVWSNKENPGISIGLRGVEETLSQEQKEQAARLWLYSARKLPKNPESAAGIYHLVRVFFTENDHTMPHLDWAHYNTVSNHSYEDEELDMPNLARTFVRDNLDEINVNMESNFTSSNSSFTWMIGKAAERRQQKQGRFTEFELIDETAMICREFRFLPQDIDSDTVRKLVDEWQKKVTDAVEEFIQQTKFDSADMKEYEAQKEVEKLEKIMHSRTSSVWSPLDQIYPREVSRYASSINRTREEERTAGQAEMNRKQLERDFLLKYGPIKSPRRIADLVSALSDNPSDLSEFSEGVKQAYKISTAVPWSRLAGRNVMVDFVWLVKQSNPSDSPMSVIKKALKKTELDDREIQRICKEAENFM